LQKSLGRIGWKITRESKGKHGGHHEFSYGAQPGEGAVYGDELKYVGAGLGVNKEAAQRAAIVALRGRLLDCDLFRTLWLTLEQCRPLGKVSVKSYHSKNINNEQIV